MIRTDSNGTTRTVSRRSTRSPCAHRSSSDPGCRSRMTKNRQVVLTATAASIATAAADAASLASCMPVERSARPAIPAARPWRAATPPSVERRRHTASRWISWVEIPAATPSRGPPSKAASTTTGVEAVYQLRGPSWTTTWLAAAATASIDSAIGIETVRSAPCSVTHATVATTAVAGIPSATPVPREGSATPVGGRVLEPGRRARRFAAALFTPPDETGVGPRSSIPRVGDAVAHE